MKQRFKVGEIEVEVEDPKLKLSVEDFNKDDMEEKTIKYLRELVKLNIQLNNGGKKLK